MATDLLGLMGLQVLEILAGHRGRLFELFSLKIQTFELGSELCYEELPAYRTALFNLVPYPGRVSNLL
jgi:hypothetical protein